MLHKEWYLTVLLYFFSKNNQLVPLFASSKGKGLWRLKKQMRKETCPVSILFIFLGMMLGKSELDIGSHEKRNQFQYFRVSNIISRIFMDLSFSTEINLRHNLGRFSLMKSFQITFYFTNNLVFDFKDISFTFLRLTFKYHIY